MIEQLVTFGAIVASLFYLLADKYMPLWLNRPAVVRKAGFRSWFSRGTGPRSPKTDP